MINWGVRRAVMAAAMGLAGAGLGLAAPSAIAASTARSGGPTAAITRLGSAAGSQRLSLVLALKTDKAGLARFATAVSTPGSSEYGQFESIPALARRFGAPPGERSRVVGYLRRAGATGVTVDGTGLFADATMSVSLASRLFATTISDFRTNTASAARFVSPTHTVHIPAGLAGAVTGVVGLDTRPLSLGGASAAADPPASSGRVTDLDSATRGDTEVSSGYATRTGTPAGCPQALAQHGFTPNQYLTAYGYAGLYAGGITGTGERVALIEINGFKPTDVSTYAKCFSLPMPNITAYGVGISKKLPPGGESTLDLEVLTAAAPGLNGIDVYESEPRASSVLQALTVPLTHRGAKPDVISVSLGDCESDTKLAIGGRNLSTVEASLQLAAASGISVLASSGDDGSSACLDPRGVPLASTSVNFPASSPWVTGVGGTNFELDASNAITAQIVWNDPDGAGGGGDSILFRRPSWQNGFSSVPHRVVPDVAMLADPAPGYVIFCTAKGECINKQNPSPWVSFGGTSAGTPLLAGGLALVDEDLRRNDRQDVGLANPLFYTVDKSPLGPQVFSDVTMYGNDLFGLLTNGMHGLSCCTAGPGFDAASGLGSVNLSGLAVAAGGIVPALAAVGLKVPRQDRPVRAEHLLAQVSCSGRCLMGAYASFQVGKNSRRRIREFSDIFLLEHKSHRTIRIGLDTSTLRTLRSALARHQRITATIYGAILDPGRNIEHHTRGQSLRIRG